MQCLCVIFTLINLPHLGPISVLDFAKQYLSQSDTLLITYQRLRLAKTLLRQCQARDRNWAMDDDD